MTKLLVISLILFTSFARAEWTKISETNDANIYIDYQTIRNEGNLRRFWTTVDFKEFAKKGIFSFRTREEIDCKKETLRRMGSTLFSGHMLSGDIIFDLKEDFQNHSIAPDSVDEVKLNIVCTK